MLGVNQTLVACGSWNLAERSDDALPIKPTMRLRKGRQFACSSTHPPSIEIIEFRKFRLYGMQSGQRLSMYNGVRTTIDAVVTTAPTLVVAPTVQVLVE